MKIISLFCKHNWDKLLSGAILDKYVNGNNKYYSGWICKKCNRISIKWDGSRPKQSNNKVFIKLKKYKHGQ